jgi:hypothetical protein
MKLEQRQKIERKVVRSILAKAKKEGFTIYLDNGEETIKMPLHCTINAMLDECFSVDEEYIILKKDGKRSFIFLVYGNSGHDVIADYSTSLEDFLSPIEKMCEKICLQS